MNGKAQQRNVIPSTAIAAAGTVTSAIHKAIYEKGIRLFVTISGVTAGGGTDGISLCAVPPSGLVPLPLAGFTGVGLLTTPGTFFADFYPGAWVSAPLAAGGPLLGLIGIQVPMQWAVRVVMGTGNAATVTVDAELMP